MSGITTYTDADLEGLLSDLESDLVERKEIFGGSAPTTVREAVCALGNDLPDYRRGGVVFIGARDDGSPTRLTITDDLLLLLADIKTDGNIVPPPTLTVSKRTLHGIELAVIIAEPSDSPPVRYRGRIHIRIGPRRGIASAQDERILSEKRRYRDHPFDLHPIRSANIGDLDRRLFEDSYLPAAVARDALDANDRTYEERLAAIQQLVRNAVMHRVYEATNAPIWVYWYDDRIEIINPGGPYGRVTPENFGKPGVVDYRNPNLAEALRV